MFGSHLERYLRAKRQGESEREESQRGKKEDPQKWKDPLGAPARHSVLPCRQSQAPHEPHRGATLGSKTETFISAQSWSDSLLLLLSLTISRLSPLSEREEQSAHRAIEVRSAQFSRPVGRGSPLRGVALLLAVLLLSALPQTVMGFCCSNSDRSAPGINLCGCPNGWACPSGRISDGCGASCVQCEAGKWNTYGNHCEAATTCTGLCTAGKYSYVISSADSFLQS